MVEAGVDTVLKVGLPTAERASEITVLRLAAGDGCVKLLAADDERGAMLLERLGPSLHDLELPVAASGTRSWCDTAQRVWRPRPARRAAERRREGPRGSPRSSPRPGRPTGRPCTRARRRARRWRVPQRAQRAHDDERAVLVHGDVHEWNALAGRRRLRSSSIPTACSPSPSTTSASSCARTRSWTATCATRASWLAARTGLDPVAIWEWGVVERVSTGLLATRIGLQPVGAQMLARADEVAELWNP